jgi:elongation of very long chain fatty acids protein 4
MLRAPPTMEFMGVQLPNVFALNLPRSAYAEHLIRVHFLSKLLDFADTIFIVLRKRDNQLSFLHLYHHSTIGGIWGLLLYLKVGGGTAIFGAGFNSLTHVFMYTHYLVASFGISHPFKAALTAWQIFQFYACFAHAVVVSLLGMESIFPRDLAYIQFFYQLSMILLFSNFYNKAYGKKGEKGKGAKKAVSATAVVKPAAPASPSTMASRSTSSAVNGGVATPGGGAVNGMSDAAVLGAHAGVRLRATTA